jgi:putative OPT family oligopeptide transporter
MASDLKTAQPSTGGLAPYREVTWEAVTLGVVQGAIMTAAFVYIALKLGSGLSGSTVAAILGFALLRGVLKKGSIVENNINQTVASGVNNASAGVAFTLPALFLLGEQFSFWSALLAALGGSFLGIVVIIPLRKQMIEFERLKFPSGIAVASLLKSPGAGQRQAQLLIGGTIIASVFHVLAFWLEKETLDLGSMFGVPAYLPITVGVTFASLGAGLLSGKGGLAFVAGGMLAWWVISPLAVQLHWLPSADALGITDAAAYADWSLGAIYSQMLRPVGIGILIGGALSGVIASFPALRSAFKSLSDAAKTGASGGNDEMPSSMIYMGIVGSLVVMFVAAYLTADISVLQSLLIAVVGTLWLGLAGLIVAQATGMTDISPISGMSMIGVTLMLFLSGGNVVASVILGVAVCLGIGQCADMMTDLKSGHLIGASPRRQQTVQFFYSWIGVPIAIGVLYLLWGKDGGGFGPSNPSLSAPQGAALAAIIESIQAGAAPLEKYVSGAAIGLGLGLFPLSGLGVLLGLAMYLPFDITFTYGIGCVIAIWLERTKGSAWISATLVPLSAGFIIGESLTGISTVLIQLARG